MSDFEMKSGDKPAKPGNTKSATTNKGPHGGGNKYDQMKIGKGFISHNPIAGHKQKSNVKPAVKRDKS